MSGPARLILVTGANGLVGRALVAELVARKLEVCGALRRPHEMLPCCKHMVVGELNGQTDWHGALAGATQIVHLAARAHVTDETTNASLDTFSDINTAGTLNLARQSAQAGVRRFVFVSTVKVNGEGKETPYSEADEPCPEDAYAMSKWEAEKGLRAIATETGMELVVLRPPLVYGPGVGANFLRLMQLIDLGLPLPLGGMNNCRSLIYIGNLVDAIATCLTQPEAANKMYLLADAEDVSTMGLIERLSEALGKRTKLFHMPRSLLKLAGIVLNKQRAMDRLLYSLTVDSSAICQELNWVPPFSMKFGLTETAKWYKNRIEV